MILPSRKYFRSGYQSTLTWFRVVKLAHIGALHALAERDHFVRHMTPEIISFAAALGEPNAQPAARIPLKDDVQSRVSALLEAVAWGA